MDAVHLGLVAERQIDAAVSRLFTVRMRLGEFDPPEVNPWRQINVEQIRSPQHLTLAHKAAAASFVLLRNRNGTLPRNNRIVVDTRTVPGTTTPTTTLAVVGPFADCQSCMFGKYAPRAVFNLTTTLADGLKAVCNGSVTVNVATGCSTPACTDYDRLPVDRAVGQADHVVVALGLGSSFESEGKDRASLALPGQQAQLLADVVAQARKKNCTVGGWMGVWVGWSAVACVHALPE